MTRGELHAERRGLTIGALCGVFGALIGCAAFVLGASAEPSSLVYLVRVIGFALVALGLGYAGAWVTWTALVWARGGRR